MLEMSIRRGQIRELNELLDGKEKRLQRELAIAVRKTAKKTATNSAGEVYQRLNATKKRIKSKIKVDVKAKVDNPSARITLEHEKRLPLRDFKARHIKAGVSYRVRRGGKMGRVSGGFMGPRPGFMATKLKGHAYKRKGRARYPIAMLHGASPWGVFKKNRLKPPVSKVAKGDLTKEINNRIRFLRLKKSGAI